MDNEEILQAGMDAGIFDNVYIQGELTTTLTSKGATVIVVLCEQVEKLNHRMLRLVQRIEKLERAIVNDDQG